MNQKIAIGLVVVAIVSFLAGNYLGRNQSKLGIRNMESKASTCSAADISLTECEVGGGCSKKLYGFLTDYWFDYCDIY